MTPILTAALEFLSTDTKCCVRISAKKKTSAVLECLPNDIDVAFEFLPNISTASLELLVKEIECCIEISTKRYRLLH